MKRKLLAVLLTLVLCVGLPIPAGAAASPVITADPADVEAHVGAAAVFSVSAAGSGLSYQWQLKTSAAASWKNTTITGYKTDTITVPVTAARLGYTYRCVVTDAGGNSVTSGEARLLEAVPFAITVQPSDFEGALGAAAVFSVAATGSGLSYQWQARTATGTRWSSCSCTDSTYSVKITAARLGYVYRCLVTNAAGETLTSGEARMLEAVPFAITADPADVEANVGAAAVFSVSATGSGLSYQWQLKTSAAASWKNTTITGYRTDTITVPVTAARLGYTYRCLVTDAAGETLSSGEARLLEAVPFAITVQPSDFEGALGAAAVFSVAATGAGLSYQWQARTATGTRWSSCSCTDGTYSVKITAARLGYVYRCLVTNAAGETLSSGEARMLEAVPFAITADPADVEANVGAAAVFSVAATGSGLSYQWQLKTSAAASWKNTTITGYKTDTITVPVTAARLGYRYRCVVTDAGGNSVTSGEARLMRAAPALRGGVTSTGLSWTLDGNGVLTISGTGPMPDYDRNGTADWRGCKNDIVSVVVGRGVTTIGDHAFHDCGALTELSFDGGITRIGEEAYPAGVGLTVHVKSGSRFELDLKDHAPTAEPIRIEPDADADLFRTCALLRNVPAGQEIVSGIPVDVQSFADLTLNGIRLAGTDSGAALYLECREGDGAAQSAVLQPYGFMAQVTVGSGAGLAGAALNRISVLCDFCEILLDDLVLAEDECLELTCRDANYDEDSGDTEPDAEVIVRGSVSGGTLRLYGAMLDASDLYIRTEEVEPPFSGIVIGFSGVDLPIPPYMDNEVVYADLAGLAAYWDGTVSLGTDGSIAVVSIGSLVLVLTADRTEASVSDLRGGGSSSRTLSSAPRKTAVGLDVSAADFAGLLGWHAEMSRGRLFLTP